MTSVRTSLGALALALALSQPLAVQPALARPAEAKAAPQAQSAAQAKPAPVADLVARVDIPYARFTLANGLRVIVHTDRKAPIVAVSTWYDVGSKHEPQGKTGFAHLFEHLMFNGSENAPGDFFAPLREVGATDFNGTTSFDRTNYFETVPRPALERALFLESDRMGYLLGAIDQAVLDEQRGVVQNEKRQGDNQPYGLVWYRLFERMFPGGHPYGHLPIGSMADLDAASLDDVKNWFRSHYGPNNAVLVLAGDITAEEARPLVEKYFGAIARGPETAAPAAAPVPLAAPVSEVMKDQVATTRIYRAWVVPGLADPDAVPLDVAGSVLGGLSSSRLDNILVRKEKLAVAVRAGAQSMVQVGLFTVSIDVRPGVDAAVAARRLDEVVADFLATGPTADEVQRVATTRAADKIEGLESVGGFGGKAVALASGELYVGDPGFYKKQLAQLAAVQPAQVLAAARKWLGKPAYALTVEPGQRDQDYAEAAKPPLSKPADGAAAAAAPAAKGTRGALPGVGAVGDLDFPDVERTRLGNGLEVVYVNRTAVPITQVVLSFDAGITADPAAALGTQALTLAVMEEGTTTMDSIQLAEAQERLGAEIATGSSADRTYVELGTPSPNLAGALDLLADVVHNPAFAPPEVERLRNQLLAKIASELRNPNALAQRTLPPLVYGPESPYAKLGAGSGDPAAVARLTRDDLVAFHRAWLRPEKAKIFVSSDRPLGEVKAALEARFGSWRGEGAPGTKDFSAPPRPSEPKIVLVDRPNSPQSVIVAGQVTPLDPKSELLPVLTANEVLGSGFLSRINMDLREAKGWSYGARGGLSRYENLVAYSISAPVQADKTGPAIASVIGEVEAFLSTRGITPVEFDRTISGEIRELAGTFETADAVLGAVQGNDLYGRPDDYYDSIAQKYRAFTIPQLDAAARAALDPDRFVWVVVGDAAKVRPQLDSLGLPVEVVSAEPAKPAASPAE